MKYGLVNSYRCDSTIYVRMAKHYLQLKFENVESWHNYDFLLWDVRNSIHYEIRHSQSQSHLQSTTEYNTPNVANSTTTNFCLPNRNKPALSMGLWPAIESKSSLNWFHFKIWYSRSVFKWKNDASSGKKIMKTLKETIW